MRVFEGILDNEEDIFLAEAIINLAQDDALLTLAILSNFATIVDKIIKINKKYDCQENVKAAFKQRHEDFILYIWKRIG